MKPQIDTDKHRCRGFTLIEVMAATAILVIIVLIMSTVFHQSSVAWDAGTRKSEGNMMARAVLAFMAHEMEEAIAYYDPLYGNIWDSGNSGFIGFITLGGTNSSSERIVRNIRYEYTNSVIKRWQWVLTAGGLATNEYGRNPDWGDTAAVGPTVLATNVDSLGFYAYPQGGGDGYYGGINVYQITLPKWVRITLAVNRTDDVSGVGGRSAGPNKIVGDGDDIKSW